MENSPNIFEENNERIPTFEEVNAVLEQLVGNEEYKKVRKLEDEKGLYLLDVVITSELGSTEYSYMRKGQYPEGRATGTAIHVAFYDESGFPVGGHSVANCIDGAWNLIP